MPAVWWLPPIFFVLVFTAGGHRYFGVPAAIGTAIVSVTLVVILLRNYGAVDLIIETDRFRAGPLVMPCTALGVAAPLDRGQAHALRAPGRMRGPPWCCVVTCPSRSGSTSPTRATRRHTGTSRRDTRTNSRPL